MCPPRHCYHFRQITHPSQQNFSFTSPTHTVSAFSQLSVSVSVGPFVISFFFLTFSVCCCLLFDRVHCHYTVMCCCRESLIPFVCCFARPLFLSFVRTFFTAFILALALSFSLLLLLSLAFSLALSCLLHRPFNLSVSHSFLFVCRTAGLSASFLGWFTFCGAVFCIPIHSFLCPFHSLGVGPSQNIHSHPTHGMLFSFGRFLALCLCTDAKVSGGPVVGRRSGGRYE